LSSVEEVTKLRNRREPPLLLAPVRCLVISRIVRQYAGREV